MAGKKGRSGGARAGSGPKRKNPPKPPAPKRVFRQLFVGPVRDGECVDCSGLFSDEGTRIGRKRVRCFACSPAKRKSGPRKLNEYRGQREESCARCAKGFVAKLPHERFCSRKCGTAWNNREKQVIARDRSPRPCRRCLTPFSPGYGDMQRVFCTPECGVAAERERPSKRGKAHIRRARYFGVAYEVVDRLKIFERDGWRCKLCATEAPRALSGQRVPNAPELDHEVPMSRGGPHTYANTRLLCRACNRAKGTRLDAELLAA